MILFHIKLYVFQEAIFKTKKIGNKENLKNQQTKKYQP